MNVNDDYIINLEHLYLPFNSNAFVTYVGNN